MPEEILYFDSPDVIQAVFAAELPSNFRRLEKAFGVKTVSRDLWLKLSAKKQDSVVQATEFIRELMTIHSQSNTPLTQHDFDLLLNACAQNRSKEVQDLFSERIKVSPRKADIVPRTKAQLEYVRAIREKDIVFGVGPAGTGKTYLAMAMAVAEFLAGNYSRIILTRPAREAGENLGFLPGNLEEKILPYLRPLYDALYDMLEFEEAAALMEKN